MIRSEIIEKFRVDNPEITTRVLTDVQCNSYLEQGDKEFCAETRCITDNGTTISTASGDQSFVLTTEISNFYDIDDWPGSGVLYNGKRLQKTTPAELDLDAPAWRAWDAGTPKKWYRRGGTLYLDREIDSTAADIIVYSVLISNDWTTDVAPYNELTYLEPFHQAMVLYLTKRAKAKIAKPEESMRAQAEYSAFVAWAKKQLGGNRYGPIFFRKKT